MGIDLNKHTMRPHPRAPQFLMDKIEAEKETLIAEIGAGAAEVYEAGAEKMYDLMFEAFAQNLSIGQTLFEANEYMKDRGIKTNDEHSWKSGFSYGQEYRNTINSTMLERMKDRLREFTILFAMIERLDKCREAGIVDEELKGTVDSLLEAAGQLGVQNIVRKVLKL